MAVGGAEGVKMFGLLKWSAASLFIVAVSIAAFRLSSSDAGPGLNFEAPALGGTAETIDAILAAGAMLVGLLFGALYEALKQREGEVSVVQEVRAI
jgi:hypothetical protein